ncbi:hypothetical protein JCM10908_003563 [Rhodotorula pacifica]|uniref:uncharacterized protein n=1 Tax=Rhodotorula pacifica TaxID=1495444 RepID=UPI00317F5222
MRTSLASVAGLLVASTVLASPFPRGRVPSLAYSSPKAFLGLDDGFSQEIGNIFFLPGFHSCGTFEILSVANLDYADFALLPEYDGSVAQKWRDAPTHVKEGNSSEGTILAWAEGWRKTCGKGEVNKEVRVSKVLVDGVEEGADRSTWAKALDAHLLPYIAALPPAPHNSVVLITSLSESTLRSLFDLASPPPSHPSPSPSPTPPTIPGQHPHQPRPHGFIWRIVAYMINLAFWACLLVALGYGGRWVARKWRERRGQGGVALPTDTGAGDEDLHVDLDSDEE